MDQHQNCPCTSECPMEKAMRIIGGKWKISILCSLHTDGPTRYNDLKRKIKGISNTMLVKSLRELEEDHLIVRKEYLEVPIRVEYEITDHTKKLIPILQELAKWSLEL